MKNNKNRLKYHIKSMLNKKQLDQIMIDQCKKNLNKYLELVGNEDYFYSLFSAKLYFKVGNISEAKKYIDIAENINNEKPSMYYLKFKLDIQDNNYDSAYDNLKKYENLLLKEGSKVNLSVYFNLLSKINGKKEYKIFFNDFINCVNIEDKYILKLWKNFIVYLLAEDYNKAKISLNSINDYIINNNSEIKLDFNELFCLLNNLNTSKSINIVNRLQSKISKLVDENELEYADNYYYLLCEFNSSKSHELLKRKINEKKLENRISTNSYLKNYHRQCFEYGKLCQYYYDYDNALNYFSAGFYVTQDPIFIYRIAKIHLFNRNLNKAKEYFEMYIKLGYKKIRKASEILSSLNSEKKYLKIEENFFSNNYESKYDLNNNEISIILNSFDKYESKIKKEKLKLLYQNGYKSIAERLLKKYKKDISNEDKNQLFKNKKLYISQSKNKM